MSIDVSKLVGDGISVRSEDLALYAHSNLVKVIPHIGYSSLNKQLPKELMQANLTKMSEDGQALYKSLKAGGIPILSIEEQNKLAAISQRLRSLVKAEEVFDGYIPESRYEAFKVRFDEIRAEFFTQRDLILYGWEHRIDSFKDSLRDMLKGLYQTNGTIAEESEAERRREAIFNEILSDVKPKEDFKSSFYMNIEVIPFSAVSGSEGLRDSIAADIDKAFSDKVVSAAVLAIENSIGKIFGLLCSALTTYINTGGRRGGHISGKTLGALYEQGDAIKYQNVFANPYLDSLSETLKGVREEDDMDVKCKTIEKAFIETLRYAKENHLSLDMKKCPYDQITLNAMLGESMAA